MEKANDELYRRLVRLGDMMGDGLHYEPGGEWIEREYKQVCISLGIIKKKPRNTKSVNEFMQHRTETEKCDCGGGLKQVRGGSFIAQCDTCGKKYRLGHKKR